MAILCLILLYESVIYMVSMQLRYWTVNVMFNDVNIWYRMFDLFFSFHFIFCFHFLTWSVRSVSPANTKFNTCKFKTNRELSFEIFLPCTIPAHQTLFFDFIFNIYCSLFTHVLNPMLMIQEPFSPSLLYGIVSELKRA